MKSLQYILYGVIIGNWLIGVKERLLPKKSLGSYVVVAMHSLRDDKVVIGRYTSSRIATEISEDIEVETNSYMAIVYDLGILSDMNEFRQMKFTDRVDEVDRDIIEEIRSRYGEAVEN